MLILISIPRASVVSISGEDHGLKSMSKWTKAVKSVADARQGRDEDKRCVKCNP